MVLSIKKRIYTIDQQQYEKKMFFSLKSRSVLSNFRQISPNSHLFEILCTAIEIFKANELKSNEAL